MSDLLSFIILNSNKYEFISIWKWINCCNDIMNHSDIYPQKMHPCSKKYLRYIKKKCMIGVIVWVFG